MALIDCPECGAEISGKAFACPHCGFAFSYDYSISTGLWFEQMDREIKQAEPKRLAEKAKWSAEWEAGGAKRLAMEKAEKARESWENLRNLLGGLLGCLLMLGGIYFLIYVLS